MHSLLLMGSKAVRLQWSNWNEVCELIPGMINEDNPAEHTMVEYHDTCGEVGPYIIFTIPAEYSALRLNGEPVQQEVHHGDYLLLLPNNKVLVVAGIPDLDIAVYAREDGAMITKLEQEFVFDPATFPVFSRWAHRNGNIYMILTYENVPEPGEKSRPGYPVHISYVNVKTQKLYTRPAHDWLRSMTRVH